jgi:hypothetical protein
MLSFLHPQLSQTAAPKCQLVTLPPEIVFIILGYLQDLDGLFCTVLTCRRLFDIFWNAQRKVMESILSGYIPLKTDRAIYRALNALRFVIRQDIIQRNVARSIFTAGWTLFKAKCREELLIPFGRALAWSFVLNDRRSDAIEILRLICEGQKPFGWSNQRPLTIQPVRVLLDQLHAEENSYEGKNNGSGIDSPRSSDFGRLPLVEISSKKTVWSASPTNLGQSEQANLWRYGILFRNQSIVMRHSKPSQLESRPGQFQRPPLHYRYHRRPEPIDDDVLRHFRELMTSGYACPTGHQSRIASYIMTLRTNRQS